MKIIDQIRENIKIRNEEWANKTPIERIEQMLPLYILALIVALGK